MTSLVLHRTHLRESFPAAVSALGMDARRIRFTSSSLAFSRTYIHGDRSTFMGTICSNSGMDGIHMAEVTLKCRSYTEVQKDSICN